MDADRINTWEQTEVHPSTFRNTKLNKTRDIPDRRVKVCTRCWMDQLEDDGHILSTSKFNKDLITKQHDDALKKIAKELTKSHPNARTWRERSWRSGTELLRPDMTMVEEGAVKIIEIILPYGKSEKHLEQRRTEKSEKYSQLLKEDG